MVPSANNPEDLSVHTLPQARRYWVAFSGGSDSTALLHFLSRQRNLKSKIHAIHVNHGLQTAADQWQLHCETFCQHHSIPLTCHQVTPQSRSENDARLARYHAFKHVCKKDDIFLTAHHQHDQIETLVLRLLRGSGLHGLSGISLFSNSLGVPVFRPLLDTSKPQILAYLNTHQLNWIEDPSNTDTTYTRNAVRQKIMPVLLKFSDHASTNISRSMHNLGQSLDLLNHLVPRDNPLSQQYIDHCKHSTALLTSLVYHWIARFDLPIPDRSRLWQFCSDMQTAAADKMPALITQYYQLNFWQQSLYLIKPVNSEQLFQDIVWTDGDVLKLPDHCGQLHLNHSLLLPLTVRFQQRGEKIKLAEKGRHQKIKKLFQQAQIPPWVREFTPFIYRNDKLIAVGDQWVDYQYQKVFTREGIKLTWEKPSLL
ncbi:tRNA lysidine(34) synthetase TilS [Marinicella sp. W31]|uniref:tRNA lysidine(34) synthetase TilS n=1 Tax=Marinicella sp. W31 TaxID=3023713 RepID=UPI003757FF17